MVCPSDAVIPSLVRDLEREFPTVLLVLHPISGKWQVYEGGRSSDWDADRVRAAIVNQYAGDGDRWWTSRGAPVIVDELPRHPGDWVLYWLRERELWRHGGAGAYLRAFEERDRKRQDGIRRSRHDENRGRADDMRRDVRDRMRGDTIRRRWSVSKTVETTNEGRR